METSSIKSLIEIILEGCHLLETTEKRFIKVHYLPIINYVEAFEDIGDYDDDFETNGWSVDFWIHFTLNNNKYTLSGSWYYGEYKITKNI